MGNHKFQYNATLRTIDVLEAARDRLLMLGETKDGAIVCAIELHIKILKGENKPSDCLYCGHELVKRDTTALGGNESFDWCRGCERVINDIDREAVDVS